MALNPASFNDDVDRLLETLIRSGSLRESTGADGAGQRGPIPLVRVGATVAAIVGLAVVILVVALSGGDAEPTPDGGAGPAPF